MIDVQREQVLALFEKGRATFVPYSTGVALRVHSQDPFLLEDLKAANGGMIQAFASTRRWLLVGEELEALLHAFLPTGVREDEVRLVLDALVTKREATTTSRLSATAEAVARAGREKTVGVKATSSKPPQLLPLIKGKDVSQIPPGPWEGRSPVLSDEGGLFISENEGAATAFTEHAREYGHPTTIQPGRMGTRAAWLVTVGEVAR